MLVLSRKLGEAIVIQDDIIVRVVEIRGTKIRLGITAPPTVSVHREEVFNALHAATRTEEKVVEIDLAPEASEEKAS